MEKNIRQKSDGRQLEIIWEYNRLEAASWEKEEFGFSVKGYKCVFDKWCMIARQGLPGGEFELKPEVFCECFLNYS